jgi:hypothetical protein
MMLNCKYDVHCLGRYEAPLITTNSAFINCIRYIWIDSEIDYSSYVGVCKQVSSRSDQPRLVDNNVLYVLKV